MKQKSNVLLKVASLQINTSLSAPAHSRHVKFGALGGSVHVIHLEFKKKNEEGNVERPVNDHVTDNNK